MIICDKCNQKINPDNEGFEGMFYEFNDGAQIHLCDEDSADFHLIWNRFIKNEKKASNE